MKIKMMALSLIAALSIGTLSAQMDKKEKASPAAKMEAKIGDAKISITYSQPGVKERVIFGELVPYGKVWRTGANEATTFTTSKDITVNGQKLAAGTYTLFTIPGEKEWTIIFNTEMGQWGAYKYDDKRDALKVKATPTKHTATERMTFSEKDGVIYLDWAETRVPLKIKS
tara:strand:- start:8 stop:520 length:513 start_codon:yes stop_codon:yes gene_type:complete